MLIEERINAYFDDQKMPQPAKLVPYSEVLHSLSEEKKAVVERACNMELRNGGKGYEHMTLELEEGLSLYDFGKARDRGMNRWRLKLVHNAMVKRNSKDILDVGCGTGLEACFYAKEMPSSRVYGLDLTQGMVDHAVKRAARLGLTNATFVQGDRDKLPYTNGSMDAVTCFNVLCEGCSPVQTENDMSSIRRMHEIGRVLRKDGLFAMTMPSYHHYTQRTMDVNSMRMEKAGFTITGMDSMDLNSFESNESIVLLIGTKD